MHTIFDEKVQQLPYSFLSHVINFYNNLSKKIKRSNIWFSFYNVWYNLISPSFSSSRSY